MTSSTSRWSHNLCEACWSHYAQENGKTLPPVRVRAVEPEDCCQCGDRNRSGIYVRINPHEMPCKGHHKEEAKS